MLSGRRLWKGKFDKRRCMGLYQVKKRNPQHNLESSLNAENYWERELYCSVFSFDACLDS